jgi:hypothetical protein
VPGVWRIPTIAELNTIIATGASGCGFGSPCIDPAFGPTQPSFYWSFSSVQGFPGEAWGVDFGGGDSSDGLETAVHDARAVRSGRR